MKAPLGKINHYPPRGSSAERRLWPCYGAPYSSWLQPWPALPDSSPQSTVSLESIKGGRGGGGDVERDRKDRRARTEKPKQEGNKDTGRLIKTEKKTIIQTSIKISQTQKAAETGEEAAGSTDPQPVSA